MGRSGEFAYAMTHLRWLFPVISCKHKLWAQSWISSIGSGLGLSRLYSTGSRLPVFASSSTQSSTLPNTQLLR